MREIMTINLKADEVFQDTHILGVVKPAGLLSVPGRGPDKQDCLITRIQVDFPNALVVHRLDQATSGIMIFALSKEIQAALGRLFEKREIYKEYEALLEGDIPAKGRIIRKQRLDIDNRPHQIIDEKQGKEGITEWEKLVVNDSINKLDNRLSRVKFIPHTGRTHQLRLHSRELGAPILGDGLYGKKGEGRMMLHSTKLEFTHPLSGEKMILLSPVPF